MNRIVRENFPVADLPDTLKEGFDEGDHVCVTFEPAQAQENKRSIAARRARLAELFMEAWPGFSGLVEIDEHIETLRREWD